jgi:hypothetical protein
MSKDNPTLGRQRLAWAILIASFSICIIISVAVPLSVNAFVQNATQELLTAVQANQGTIGLDDESGVRRAVIAGDAAEIVEPNTNILTDASATGILMMSTPEDETLLTRINIGSNTTLILNQASAPRFAWSDNEHNVDLELSSGRVRLTLLDAETRPTEIQMRTPQGGVTIREPGQYSIAVSNEATQVAVQEGALGVTADGSTLVLAADERAEIPTGGAPQGPLSPERNLIRNGGFNEGFDHWSEYTWKIELADQPSGKTEIKEVDGEPTLHFERIGVGHADARVLQSVNQGVGGFESLRLLVTLRILEQSLGVCGIQGSECPLFIRIDYTDENGANQIWQHGFFATGEVDDNMTPGACVSCAVIQGNHERVPQGQDYFYEVDLRDELARQGALPPRSIESISLIASGHSFATEIVDVALMVGE